MVKNFLYYFEKDTDAIGTNRGFYYQYLVTLKRWLLADDCLHIYCETEDDIKVVDLNSNRYEFSQIKCYKSDFSLSSPEVKKTICNFFILYQKYGTNGVSFVFESNNDIFESDILFSKWQKNYHKTNQELLNEISEKVKAILNEYFLKEWERQRKVKEKKIEKLNQKIDKLTQQRAIDRRILELSNCESELDELNETYSLIYLNFKEKIPIFVKKIEWRFGGLEPEEVINKLEQESITIIENGMGFSKGSGLIFSRLLSEVIKKSQETNSSNRCLNKALLGAIIAESKEEMMKNAIPQAWNLISSGLKANSSKLDILLSESKEQIGLLSNLTYQQNKPLALPYYEQEALQNRIKAGPEVHQSNLERKIKNIGLASQAEIELIEIATDLRATYLLHLDELKSKNLMHEHNILKGLENRIIHSYMQLNLMSKKMIPALKFWNILQEKLNETAKRHGELTERDLDEQFATALMYQKAAECKIKWEKM